MPDLFVRKQDKNSYQSIIVQSVEKHYNALFVGDFALRTRDGGWSESPVAIFYQPNPNTDLGHTHYFGILVDHHKSILITRGDSAFEQPIDGIIADNGEVIFSRYRHDYVTSLDGSVWIDGGRDYTRSGLHGLCVKLIIDKDNLVIDPNSLPKITAPKITTLTLR